MLGKVTSDLTMLCVVLALAHHQSAHAEQVIFPKPVPERASLAAPPAWLTQGSGDDGYLSVVAEVKLPAGVSCVPFGKSALFSKESTQAVISLKTSGFQTALDGREIPIATIDSRGAEGECIAPITLPIAIVPLTKLESRSTANAGQLRIIVNVRSTVQTKLLLIEKGQLALGAAAVLATGGAATTVASLSAAFGKEALAPLVKEFESSFSNVTAGAAPVDLDWIQLRSGPASFEIPVYAADTTVGESAAEAIRRLQGQDLRGAIPLFRVVLRFAYVRSIFDEQTTGIDALPRLSQLLTATVLRYPTRADVPNLLQALSADSPTLQQKVASKKDLAATCNEVYSRLQAQLGLAVHDRAVALKAFVDESLGTSTWIQNAALFNACFRDLSDARSTIVKLFSPAGAVYVLDDAQDDVATAEFLAWQREVPPRLAELRRVLTGPGDRNAVLIKFMGTEALTLADYAGWAVAPPATAVPRQDSGGSSDLENFTSRRVKKMGCFAKANQTDLNINKPTGHALLQDEQDGVWHATVTFGNAASRKPTAILIEKINPGDGWANYFKGLQFMGANSECKVILQSI